MVTQLTLIWLTSSTYLCLGIVFCSSSNSGIVGSVVECSPATRAARVRFPDDAWFFASKQMQHECHYDLFLLSPMQRKLTYFEYNNSREGQCVANFLSPTDLPSIQLQITDQWEPRVGAGDVVTCAVFSLARIGSPDMTAVQASICRIT